MPDNKPVAGGKYRHNKTGHIYTVLAVGVYCGKFPKAVYDPNDYTSDQGGLPEGTRLVVYVGHYDNPRGNEVYVRPVDEWAEEVRIPQVVGQTVVFKDAVSTVPRYERIDE